FEAAVVRIGPLSGKGEEAIGIVEALKFAHVEHHVSDPLGRQPCGKGFWRRRFQHPAVQRMTIIRGGRECLAIKVIGPSLSNKEHPRVSRELLAYKAGGRKMVQPANQVV